jgi:MFS family permease
MKPTLNTAGPASTESIARPLERDSYPPAAYAWYVVGVLTLAYIVSFIDRQILNLMVDPIRHDLGIGEKEMSLLMGASFAVFYTFFGIPLGRLADTRSRRAIIAGGIALWSVMTAGCGLTKKFWQLALMRMGVGVGEASLSPSAYSLISDYFRPELRSTAISVYSMGIYIGSGLALILGGLVIEFASGHQSPVWPWVEAVHPWQLVFFLVGLPGLLVALLLLTIREPARQGVRRTEDGSNAEPPASPRAVWDFVRDNRATFLHLNLGIALLALDGYGAVNWIPSLFIRRHAWTQGQTGLVFGLIVAVSGTLGIVTGGRLADWLRQGGHADANLRVALLGAAGWVPFGLLFPVVPAGHWAAALLAPAVFFMSMPFGVAPAAIQQMMPNTMRAQASALYLFVINLIGMGLGPTLVATLTEDVFRDKNAVHHSLLVVGAFAHGSAAILLWVGLKHYRRSLDYLKEWRVATGEEQSAP